MEQQAIPIKVFYSYAHEDESLQKELDKHLINLKRQGFITTWHSQEAKPGTEWKREVDLHLNSADIILLLVSPDFMASCSGVEMEKVLKRHYSGEARVIPIILRPVDWEGTSLRYLQVLPYSGKPITSWPNQDGRDEAFREVAVGIRDVITVTPGLREEHDADWAAYRKHGSTAPPLMFFRFESAIAELQINRASVYCERQNYEEALAIYEEVLRLDPDNSTALIGKGDALQKLQRYQEALVAYEHTAAHRGKGDVLYKLSRWSEALGAYEQALRLDPDDSVAYRGKGDTLQALRRGKEALNAYEQALRLDPNDSLAAQRKTDLAEKSNGEQEDNLG